MNSSFLCHFHCLHRSPARLWGQMTQPVQFQCRVTVCMRMRRRFVDLLVFLSTYGLMERSGVNDLFAV